jgi:3-isopropylmalate/(R)-2-methylmalate dehydratase small subunit
MEGRASAVEPFRTWTGLVAILDRANVDTDQIIPKRFLKSIERTGFASALFADWRFRADGAEEPGFVLNHARYRGATVLVAGPNFGCGSSREHAAWALRDYGIRAIVAPSFADIFRANCVENGLVTAEAAEADVRQLMAMVERHEGLQATVDLEAQTIQADAAAPFPFLIADASRERLRKGADAIAMTLEREAAIRRYEATLVGA